MYWVSTTIIARTNQIWWCTGMLEDGLWYCQRKRELFVKCSLSHVEKWVHWLWCLETASRQLKEHSRMLTQKQYIRETLIQFFWVCGYNKLNKSNEGNLVFADDWASMWAMAKYAYINIKNWVTNIYLFYANYQFESQTNWPMETSFRHPAFKVYGHCMQSIHEKLSNQLRDLI